MIPELILLVNAFLTALCWKAAKVDFDNGRTVYGWISIFLSALNAASFAYQLTSFQ